jgi:hypothetical protein
MTIEDYLRNEIRKAHELIIELERNGQMNSIGWHCIVTRCDTLEEIKKELDK